MTFRFLYQLTTILHSAVSVARETIERLGMVTSLSLEVQGPGSPYPSRSGVSNCFGMFGNMFGVYAGIIFQKLLYFETFPIFSVLKKHIFLEICWCFDSSLTATFTQNSYHSDEWAFHHSLVFSDLPWRRAARFAMSPICFLDTTQVETMTLQQIMLVSSL